MKNLNSPAAVTVMLAWLTCGPTYGSESPMNDLDATLGRMRGVIERYSSDQSSLGRYDGTPMSPERFRRLKEFYESWQRAAESMDFDGLDQDGRIDYLLLRNDVAHRLHTLEHQRRRDEEVQPLVPFWQPIVELEQARKRMEWADPAASAEKLAKLSRAIADARKAIDKELKTEKESKSDSKTESGKPSRVVANRAAQRVEDMREALEGWHKFYAGFDPEFTWWASQPYKEANGDLEKYAKFLRDEVVKRPKDSEEVIGDPIGREALLAELRFELIPYTPEELID